MAPVPRQGWFFNSIFKMIFLKILANANYRRVFAQTVTYTNVLASLAWPDHYFFFLWGRDYVL